jgi:hypothetical protein
MSIVQAEQGPRNIGRSNNPAALLWLIASGLVLAISPFWLMRWWPNTDITWLVTVGEKMLSGQQLYVDVIETNPPFSVWLYLPAVIVAQWLGLDATSVVAISVFLIVFISLALTAKVAHASGFLSKNDLLALLPGLLVVTLIWPGNSFAEREHIGVVSFLPFTVLVAWRATVKPRSELTPGLTLAVGLCASLLLLVKPYYAVVPFALSAHAAWRRRDLSLLFTPENMTIGVVCLAYLASVWYLHPEFLYTIYPLLEETYMRHTRYATVAQVYFPSLALIVIFARLFYGPTAFPQLPVALFIAAAAACMPLAYQGKGWSYHAYPALAFAVIAFLVLIFTRVGPRENTVKRTLLFIAAFFAASAIWAPFYRTERPDSEILQHIKEALPGPRTVAVLGTDIATANNISRLIGGDWIGRYCSDWLGGMAAWLADFEQVEGNFAEEEKYRQLASSYKDAKYAELVQAQPNLVIIQQYDPVWGALWRQDQRFEDFLEAFQMVGENDYAQAWVRFDPTPSSPAAGSD